MGVDFYNFSFSDFLLNPLASYSVCSASPALSISQCTELYEPGGYLAHLLEISFIINWRVILVHSSGFSSRM